MSDTGKNVNNGILGFIYFLTIIAAEIYYLSHATNFWWGLVGFLQGFIWPLFAALKVFDLLKM
jgi:hypothetical protein